MDSSVSLGILAATSDDVLVRARSMAARALLLVVAGCGRSPVFLFGSGSAGDGDGGPIPSRCGELDVDYYAQVVVDYVPTAGGGQVPQRDDVIDPEAALGPPDHMPTPPLGTVSIGDGGTLTVGFEPCVMGTSRSSAPDLIVHEAGFDEQVSVELRPTAEAQALLGPAVDPDGYVRLSTRPDVLGAIDLDAALVGVPAEGLRFTAVRIRDVPGQGLETVNTPGADIDAIEITVPLDDR